MPSTPRSANRRMSVVEFTVHTYNFLPEALIFVDDILPNQLLLRDYVLDPEASTKDRTGPAFRK